MRLVTALLVANFGHGSLRPKRTAVMRLLLLLLGSLLLCFIGIRSAQAIPILPTILVQNSLFSVWFVLHCILVCVNLTTSHTPSPTASLLSTLPVPPLHRKMLNCLNHFVYTAMLCCSITPVFFTFLHRQGINAFVIAVVVMTAIVGGCGLFYMANTKRGFLITLGFLAIEYYALQQLLSAGSQRVVWKVLLLSLGVICCLGLTKFGVYANREYYMRHTNKVFFRRLSNRFWFAKKVVRSPVIKSLLASTFFSVCLALYVRHIRLTDSTMLSFVASILGASSASDIRSLCRSRHPAEILSIRGTAYFLVKEHLAASSIFLTLSPLMLVALAYSPTIELKICLTVSVMVGILLGLFVGTIITPYPGDISAQAMAVTCSSIALLAIQKFSPHLITYCCLAIFCVAGTFAVEFIRNPYTWRYYRGIKKSSSNY